MGLRDYRGIEEIQPRRKPQRETDEKSRERYLKQRVKRKKLKGRKMLFKTSLMAMLIFLGGFFVVSRDMKIYNTQKEINILGVKAKEVKEKNEDLRIKLLQNSSLEKIEKKAKDKLDMISPSNEDIVDFKNPVKTPKKEGVN